MKKSKTLLEKEAEYQDSRVESDVRKQFTKYYSDKSSDVRHEYIKELVGDIHGKIVLDYGCGTGEASMDALARGAYVTAIDISPKSIEYLKKQADDRGFNDRLTAIVADANHLPCESNSFDIVIGNGILHHLPDLNQALNEVKRVLKPTGYAVFSEPLGMNPFINLYRLLTPDCRTPDEQPFRVKELNLIKQIFTDSEFKFFECATLFTKFLLATHMYKAAYKIEQNMIRIDNKLLKSSSSGVTFFQRMSWVVIIKLIKH